MANYTFNAVDGCTPYYHSDTNMAFGPIGSYISGSQTDWMRGLLHFDLSSIVPTAKISAVSLFMYHTGIPQATYDETYRVYRVPELWDAAYAKRSMRTNSLAWSLGMYGADIYSAITLSTGESNGWKEWAFNQTGIDLITSFAKNLDTNYGFCVRHAEAWNPQHIFAAPGSGNPPYLSMTYTVNGALKMASIY